MPQRHLAFAASLSLALLFFAGCHRPETDVARGDREQILYLGNLEEPADLDPQTTTIQTDFNIVQALFEGLASYDPRTCQPDPGVAEHWEVAPDNLTWTFHLRHDARWSNGDPVTAHDFVYAYHRALSPRFGCEYAYLLYALKNGEAFNAGKIADFSQVGVHAPDDFTLVLTLAHPVPYLPSMVCHQAWYPVHQATIEKFGRMDERGTLWTRPGNLVGNGPFVLTEWKPQQYVRVSKSPTYWDRARVRLREVYFYPIENEDAEERAFRAGQLHVTSTMPIEKIAVYARAHSPFYHPHPFLGTYFYRFNVTRPPLNDVRVRRALALSIDRGRIVRDVARGHQQPAGHLTPPDTAGFYARANVPYDLPAAQKLLAAAGYPGGRGFPHLDILFNTNEGHRAIAEAIQQMWRTGLGIDVGLVNQEGKVWSDSMRRLDYQVARYAWIGDYLDPSTFLELMAGDSGNNQTGWDDPEYDRLLAAAAATADQAKRFADYQRCEQILAEQCPIAPIYFYTRNNLRRPEVKGWFGNLLDAHPLKGVYLDPAAAVPSAPN